ncbi:MAG: hypothetical protein AB1714_01015 [Acidobacteriota bacterium]
MGLIGQDKILAGLRSKLQFEEFGSQRPIGNSGGLRPRPKKRGSVLLVPPDNYYIRRLPLSIERSPSPANPEQIQKIRDETGLSYEELRKMSKCRYGALSVTTVSVLYRVDHMLHNQGLWPIVVDYVNKSIERIERIKAATGDLGALSENEKHLVLGRLPALSAWLSHLAPADALHSSVKKLAEYIQALVDRGRAHV